MGALNTTEPLSDGYTAQAQSANDWPMNWSINDQRGLSESLKYVSTITKFLFN